MTIKQPFAITSILKNLPNYMMYHSHVNSGL